MAMYLVRAGRRGEQEDKFLDDSRAYLLWGEFFADRDISLIGDYGAIKTAMLAAESNKKPKALINGASQINIFVHGMNTGDLIVLPLKKSPTIAVGIIKSAYIFDQNAEVQYRHYREVEWLARDIPRSAFDSDLLFSFGAFMSVCRISRNDAESRVRAMQANNWMPLPVTPSATTDNPYETGNNGYDLEEAAQDQLISLLEANFKGHTMEWLVEGILQAQGYTTWRTAGGPDKGIDILAASDNLGFGNTKICVQVKSGSSPLDRPTLDQIAGAIQRAGANCGLIVAWGGVNREVESELPRKFFELRIWDRQELIRQLLEVYDKLEPELRTAIPLKRIWIVADSENAISV